MIRSLLVLLLLAGPASAFELSGDRGTVTLDEPPETVVALSWGLAELLVELGIRPAGVADPDGYATWVARPELPDGVTDVGLRNEPNLERIAELEPDLILSSDQQAGIVPRLGRIAPTVHVEAFAAGHDNAAVSRETFLDLARAFGREDVAERKLAALDERIAAAGARVRDAFGGEVPPVVPVRLLTPTSVRIHGANSMAKAALDGMGLTHPAPGEPSEWGFRQARPEALAAFEDAAIVHIDPFPQKEELFSSPLWQGMPFVQADRFAVAEPVWTFGGVFSLGYLAESLADALVAMAEGA